MPVNTLLPNRQVATRAGQVSLLAAAMMTAALLPTFVESGVFRLHGIRRRRPSCERAEEQL